MTHQQKLSLIKNGLMEKECKAKPKKPLKKISDKKAAENKSQKEKKGESGLDKYFDYHTKHSVPKCENCGMEAKWLLEPQEDEKKQKMYELMWRASQAHVLKKKDGIGGFPSVSTSLTNHLVLFPRWGGYLCGCHDKFDESYEAMAKMPIFKKAIDIINQLYPLIAADEKKYLPEIILQELKPTIYIQSLKLNNHGRGNLLEGVWGNKHKPIYERNSID